MPKLRVHNFSISFDGYAAGPGQDLEHPLGIGGERLHEWFFAVGGGAIAEGVAGAASVDDEFVVAGDAGIGATIIGRNMFGPVRGEWGDEEWRGWWGEEPPYHHPVFVLTHHARPPLEMEGGTTFHFVTDGIEAASARAFDAADGLDVRVGGGASVVQQYWRAGLIDELHLAIAPVLLGSGERLFEHLGDVVHDYDVAHHLASERAIHLRLLRRVR